MAAAGVTTTGLKEARAGVDRLPELHTAALRQVAFNSAQRAAAGMRARVPVRTGKLKRSIHVVADDKNKQMLIKVGDIDGPPIALFVEFGTVRAHPSVAQTEAKPFMGPAMQAESPTYRREMEVASARAAESAFSGVNAQAA